LESLPKGKTRKWAKKRPQQSSPHTETKERSLNADAKGTKVEGRAMICEKWLVDATPIVNTGGRRKGRILERQKLNRGGVLRGRSETGKRGRRAQMWSYHSRIKD